MARRERGSSVARQPPAAVAVNEFDEVVQLIEEARRQATRAVNVKLIELYWKIGAVISRRIESDGWGKGTVQKLAAYLSRTQRGARGFSPQNLWRMRQFFEAYRDAPELSKLVRELSWSANLYILGGTKRPEEREFYLRMAIKKGWNVRELARQIEAATFERSVLGSPKLSTALRQLHPEAAEDFKEVYSAGPCRPHWSPSTRPCCRPGRCCSASCTSYMRRSRRTLRLRRLASVPRSVPGTVVKRAAASK